MAERALVLIEDDPLEATLARTALMLHAGRVQVLLAADVQAALAALGRSAKPVVLAILGKRAALRSIGSLSVPAVAIAAGLTAAQKRRARAAGIAALYERPRQWRAYSALVQRLLAEWLPTRTDSPPRPAPTS